MMRLAEARGGKIGFTLKGWVMHPGRAVVVLLGLVALVFPTQAAPLNQDRNQSPGPPAADGDRILPGPPVARAKAAAVLADRDGNRLSDGLEAMLAGLGPDDSIDVIVTFSGPGPGNAAAAQAAVGAFDVRHEYHLIQGFAATMSAAQAQAMAGVAGVFRVEEDATATAFMESARADFGVDRVYEAANPGQTGAGIHICIIDTGIEDTHQVFVDELTSQNKVVAFQDFIGDIDGVFHDTAYDDHGHGSHVASIAAGDGTGSTLAARLRGVAPGAFIHAAKVLDANGSGSISGIIAGIQWCVDQQVHVANMSLGVAGSSDGNDALSQASNQAVIDGVVVVAAAGNEGGAPKTIGSPAAAEFLITVGAAGDHSADPMDPLESAWFTPNVVTAPFSSRGPTRDGRVKPDILAPGITIAAALADYYGIYAILSGCNNDCYTVLSGTSMASPFVAGVVALMKQADVNLTPAQVAQILYDTAQDQSPVPGKDNDKGHGFVDAYAAVEAALGYAGYEPTAFPTYAFGSDSVGKNGVTQIPITVTDTSAPLAITITIDGSLGNFGWNPDIEARLLDANGDPFVVPNPYWPILGPEFIPQPGTLSTCPAGDFCGAAGRQETLYFAPAVAGNYMVEVFPYPDWPNRGKGGSFTYEIWQGPVAAAAPPPPPPNESPISDAGGDQTVDDPTPVYLDGSGSSDPDGTIMAYVWTENGTEIATGMMPTSLPFDVGTHNIMLTVTDNEDATDTDTMVVTVVDPSAPNDPPTADAGPDQEVNYNKRSGQANVSLDGSGSFDPDGSIVSYIWTSDTGATASGVTATMMLDKAASHTITLTVTDNQGAPATDTKLVTEKVKGGGKSAGKSTAAR
jgi:serine protease AprX